MASITTILGTDSVSSSRIVLNNNFAALNTELAEIANLFNTTSQTLTLTGLITGGTLKVNNGTLDTFKVNSVDATVNVPVTFNQDVIIGNALIHSVYPSGMTTLPSANSYNYTTYVLDATNPTFSSPVLLADADNGQEITFISAGGTVTLDNAAFSGVTQDIQIFDSGSLTIRYIGSLNNFFVISASNCLVTN